MNEYSYSGVLHLTLSSLTCLFLFLVTVFLFLLILRVVSQMMAECLNLLERLEDDRLPTYLEAVSLRDGSGPILKHVPRQI